MSIILKTPSNGSVTLAEQDTASDVVVTIPATTGNAVISTPDLAYSPFIGFRNRIINGAMVIDQRNAGAAVTYTNSNSYNLDRYLTDMSPNGSLQIQQVSDAPAGFVYSMKGTILTATAGSSGQAAYLARHIIEGNNIADFGWGSANAQTATLSFWAKSSVTGTFSVGVANGAFNRGYAATYTINVANTWEFKSLIIPGDTSGTWLTTNGIGIRLYWNIGSGSSFLGAANVWQGSGLIGATGSTSIINTLNATFYITGVQLEKGSTATPFEFRSIGDEFALCQRYYETCPYDILNVGYGTSGQPFYKYSSFNTAKRAAPTVTYTNVGASGFNGAYATNTAHINGVSWTTTCNFTGAGTLFAVPIWFANAEL